MKANSSSFACKPHKHLKINELSQVLSKSKITTELPKILENFLFDDIFFQFIEPADENSHDDYSEKNEQISCHLQQRQQVARNKKRRRSLTAFVTECKRAASSSVTKISCAATVQNPKAAVPLHLLRSSRESARTRKVDDEVKEEEEEGKKEEESDLRVSVSRSRGIQVPLRVLFSR